MSELIDDQIYLVKEFWSGFTLFQNGKIYNIDIGKIEGDKRGCRLGPEINIDGWTHRIYSKRKNDFAEHPAEFQCDLYPNFRFRLGWIEPHPRDMKGYLLWVNDIPVEEMPQLIDPSFGERNPEQLFNRADAETTINGKKFDLNCQLWTPALQQDRIDKFIGPSELIRSIEIHSFGGNSLDVINGFLHRLLSQDIH